MTQHFDEFGHHGIINGFYWKKPDGKKTPIDRKYDAVQQYINIGLDTGKIVEVEKGEKTYLIMQKER